MADEPLIPPHGNYQELKAFQNSQIIHDTTVVFCRRFFRPTDRTVDQMVQAARSGKQNIVEGSSVSGTSKSLELKLIGVRASLEELLNDYFDFIRQRGFQLWDQDHEKARFIRNLAKVEGKSYATYKIYIEEKRPETAANTMVCLIKQTTYLLDRLKLELGERLLEEGGMSERIYRERKKRRGH